MVAILSLIYHFPGNFHSEIEWISGNHVVRIGFFIFTIVWTLFFVALKRWKTTAFSFFLCFILFVNVFKYIPFGSDDTVYSSKNKIKVLALNVEAANAGSIPVDFRSLDLDIAILSEVSEKNVEWISYLCEPRNLDLKHVPIHQDSVTNNAIISSTPLYDVRAIPLESTFMEYRNCIFAKTKINGVEISILGVHLEPHLDENNRREISESWKTRERQTEQIISLLENNSNPVIVAGDFNTTPTDKTLRKFRKTFTDSWQVAGRGLGGTWQSHIALFRIDYIFFKGFKAAANGRTMYFDNSDHRACIVDLYPDSIRQ